MEAVLSKRLALSLSLMLMSMVAALFGRPASAVSEISVKDADTGLSIVKESAGYRAISGERLQFSASGLSSAPSWSFGDGASSIEYQPIHVYTAATDTTFVVKLSSGIESRSVAVVIDGALGTPLSGRYLCRYTDDSAVTPSSILAGRLIRFTATDAADRYRWDFGDGVLVEGSPVVHGFQRAGSYTVRLSVTRAGLPEVTSPAPTTFVAVPPPDAPQWMIPGIAYTDGLGGALWQSDLSLFNPHRFEPMTLSIAFLDARELLPAGGQPRWSQITLAPLQSATLVNVLNGAPFFLPRGTFGALVIRGDAIPAAPAINARTYDAGSPEKGTKGLSNTLMSSSAGIEAGSRNESDLIGLRESPAHYTNFGVANLKGDAASVEVRFTSAAGLPIGSPVSFRLAPYGVAQLNHVLSAAPPEGAGYARPEEGFTASVKLVSGTAVAPYATVIDTASNDPIFLTPASHPHSSYRLPGVVRAHGARGTVWRSDVVVFNPSDRPRAVTLSYSYRESRGSGRRTVVVRSVSIPTRGTFEVDDFVKSWLGLSEDDRTDYTGSYLDVAPAAGDLDSGPLLVLGRTYNDQPTGEVGLGVPGFTTEDTASASGPSRSLVLSGLQSNAARRSNVVLFLVPGPGAVTNLTAEATVQIRDGSGRKLKSVLVRLDAVDSLVQLNDADLFGDLSGSGDDLSIIVDGLSGETPIAAYATMIDPISGDGTFVAAQPAP